MSIFPTTSSRPEPTRPRAAWELTTRWQFDAPLPAVWAAIADIEAWPAWWPGIERVIRLESGAADGLCADGLGAPDLGPVRQFTCKSVLPYRLTFISRVTRIEPMRLLEGIVQGELEGTGTCRVWMRGGCTCVRYDWRVRATRPGFIWLARLAAPMVRWNHDAIMAAGGCGLARHLGTTGRGGLTRGEPVPG